MTESSAEKTVPSEVKWNDDIRLVVSDVDETVADLFVPAAPEMATKLNGLLDEGRALFLVSGAGLGSIKRRVMDLIRPDLRKRVLIAIVAVPRSGDLTTKAMNSTKPFIVCTTSH